MAQRTARTTWWAQTKLDEEEKDDCEKIGWEKRNGWKLAEQKEKKDRQPARHPGE
jgi:hypothetical protein